MYLIISLYFFVSLSSLVKLLLLVTLVVLPALVNSANTIDMPYCYWEYMIVMRDSMFCTSFARILNEVLHKRMVYGEIV